MPFGQTSNKLTPIKVLVVEDDRTQRWVLVSQLEEEPDILCLEAADGPEGLHAAWAEDGAGGAGFMRGTNRVGFLFLIDNVKVRVNTFTSNQRWKMDDPKILEAISKADMMVQILETAKQASGS